MMDQIPDIPDWLQAGLPVSTDQELRLTAIAANWLRLFAARSTLSETDCLAIIILELHGKKRPELIGRVKAWYDKLRSHRENIELWVIHPGAGVRTRKRKVRK